MAFTRLIKTILKNGTRTFVTKAERAKILELQMTKCLPKLRETFETDQRNGFIVPVYKKSLLYTEQIAVKDRVNEYTYYQLFMGAKRLSFQISNICGSGALCNIAIFCSNEILFPLIQWATWMSGQIVVPLRKNLPMNTLKYIIEDSKMKLIISTPENEQIAKALADQYDTPLIVIDHNFILPHDSMHLLKQKVVLMSEDKVVVEGVLHNDFYTISNAMLHYGTRTNENPTGCILSHQNLDARIRNLATAWQCKSNDCILNLFPLEKIGSDIHILMGPLSVGGKILLNDKTNYHDIWSNILGINKPTKERPNVLMAQPSVFEDLIFEYEKIFHKDTRMVEYIKHYCMNNFRLMISGSESLPREIFNRWKEITGHKLLRYYDMVETGLALSNPYLENKDKERQPDEIGLPLPETKVRLVNSLNEVLVECDGDICRNSFVKVPESQIPHTSTPRVGELQISGPNVFKGYFNLKSEPFFSGNYFKTGDIAAYENGTFKILGQSDNLIKTEGKCVSCDKIESILCTHPEINDAVVVGVPHVIWSDKICAVCVLSTDSKLNFQELQSFCAKCLPSYMCPAMLKIVKNIHRNSNGKTNRKYLLKLYFA